MAATRNEIPNYYQVLGVPAHSSVEDIKRAYKRRAQELHPDHNQGDSVLEDEFKSLNEAYQVLSNPAARSVYDRHRASVAAAAEPNSSARPPKPSAWKGFLSKLFGEGPPPEHGQDLRVRVRVPLGDLVNSTRLHIDLPTSKACPACSGLGLLAPKDEEGEAQKCSVCIGSGRQTIQGKLEVNLPIGLEDGSTVKLREEGEPGLRGGRDGDLYLEIEVIMPARLERKGQELRVKVPIDLGTALTGGQVSIPGARSALQLKIPAGTQSGDQFKLPGQGMPPSGGGRRGDLFATVEVEIPTRLSQSEADSLGQALGKLDKMRFPKTQAFRETVEKKSP